MDNHNRRETHHTKNNKTMKLICSTLTSIAFTAGGTHLGINNHWALATLCLICAVAVWTNQKG